MGDWRGDFHHVAKMDLRVAIGFSDDFSHTLLNSVPIKICIFLCLPLAEGPNYARSIGPLGVIIYRSWSDY
jgi:hypothetical protein